MKCPACNKHELKESAWLPCEGGHYEDDNYYDCANCGPVQKDYVDAVQARVEELEGQKEQLVRVNVNMATINNRVEADNKAARALMQRVVAAEGESSRQRTPLEVIRTISAMAQWLDTSNGEQ